MVIVTGSSGFIGSAITKSLGNQAIPISQSVKNAPNGYRLDLTNQEQVAKLISSIKNQTISHLIHCAATAPWQKDPDFSLDLKMAKNVAEICTELQIENLIFVSGWVVYDVKAKTPITETSRLAPSTPYGKSKLAAENYFKKTLPQTTVLNLRLASVYGPGQSASGLIPNLVKAALSKGVISINSLQTKRDYLYIDDLIKIIAAALVLKIEDNLDINIGSGHSVDVQQVAEFTKDIFFAELHKDIEVRVNQPISESVPIDNELSIAMAKKLKLITNTTNLKVGLKQYIKWVYYADLF